MTTDLNTLRVETRELVIYARERQEDAIVCHAIRLYTDEVGAIPGQAFGTIPEHSDRYRRDWARLLAARGTEEVTARDELWNMSGGLLQVAADYEHTDIEIAYTFDVEESGISAYLNSMRPPAESSEFRPGDPVGGRAFPRWAPFGARAGELPGQDQYNATHSEPLPSTRELPSTYEYQTKWDWRGMGVKNERVEVPHTEAQPGLENDRLFEFVKEHGPLLQQLERIVESYGLHVKKPLGDVIIHVYLASPKIIRNRSLLLGRAKNALDDIQRKMTTATENLKYYWSSPGATGVVAASGVFFTYADTTQAYLDHVADSVEWWSKQGVELARVLEGLRNAYADTGYKRINELYSEMQKYNEAIQKSFSSCREPEKALATALTSFANAVYDSAKSEYVLLQDLIKVEDQRRREEASVDVGSLIYGEPTPFPHGRTNTGAWSGSSGWSPKPNRPADVSGSS